MEHITGESKKTASRVLNWLIFGVDFEVERRHVILDPKRKCLSLGVAF